MRRTWARISINSLDMPNTLSMYDTVSCVFVFVSLSGSSQGRLASTPHPHVGGTRWREGDDAPPAIDIQQCRRASPGEAAYGGRFPVRDRISIPTANLP